MKKIIYLFLIAIVCKVEIFSQTNTWSFDFENAEQINSWAQANVDDFSISDLTPINGSYSLKHTSPNTAGVKQSISFPLVGLQVDRDSTVWFFKIKYDNNNPSTSNKFYIWLYADKPYWAMTDPSGNNINGYVFGVNYGSTSDDIIKIWRIKNGSSSSSYTYSTGITWSSTMQNVPLAFRVKRTYNGYWEVFYSSSGDYNNLQSVLTFYDAELKTANNFGITFFYTSTFTGKFWFDDLVISGYKEVDTVSPTVLSVDAISKNKLQVVFSENVSSSTAQNVSNYSIQGLGAPSLAELQMDGKTVILSFDNNFVDSTSYLLDVAGVSDVAGNTMQPVSVQFTYYRIKIIKVVPSGYNKIDVYFSKSTDKLTAENLSNYSISGFSLISATQNSTLTNIVSLVFNRDFDNNVQYTLSVQGVTDVNGDTILPTNFDFLFYITLKYDVIINELMVDVNPAPVALPPNKYIELYNRTNQSISLYNWKLKIGTNTARVFPDVSIPPFGYVIICSSSAQSLFNAFGITVPILREDELTATTGKTIVLYNNFDNIIEQITYDPKTWYNDPNKDDGGWSMERIDPNNVCSQETNWRATLDYTGGTPGRINSVFGSNPDLSRPYVTNFMFVTSHKLFVSFSEVPKMSELSVNNFLINGTISPASIIVDTNDSRNFTLYFADHFPFGTDYLLVSGVKDPCDNVIKDTIFSFYYQLLDIKDVEVKSNNQLVIYFTEPVSLSSAQNVNNYVVNKNIQKPVVAFRDPYDSSKVHLQFNNNFLSDTSYIITVSNIEDSHGHKMTTANRSLVWHEPQRNDVVFNELMIDVNPVPAGLPACQYIEIFNTTKYDIWLTNWSFLAEGQKSRVFPAVKLPSKGFALICKPEDASKLSNYGIVIPVLGSDDLTQSGKVISLYDYNNQLISTLRYSKTWYKDKTKENGGWSLEKIDPYNFCETDFNWAAANDIKGGTPGTDNSIYQLNPDNRPLKLLSANFYNSKIVTLYFSKEIDFTKISPNNFSANGVVATSYYFSDTSGALVYVVFNNQFFNGQQVALSISNLSDNCGNVITDTTVNLVYKKIHIKSILLVNNFQIQLNFSEIVDLNSSIDVQNYYVNNSIGNPVSVVRSVSDNSIVFLQFSATFSEKTVYTLTVRNVKDVNGNAINDTSFSFSYYMPKENDLVINEILFNPFPNCVDFVEIYNRCDQVVDLRNVSIANRNTANEISSLYRLTSSPLLLNPGEYIAITTDTNNVKNTYPVHGNKFLQLKTMPSFPDDKGVVVLLNADGLIIDEFAYNKKMHFNLLSNVEGISLERINPNKPTNFDANWHSAATSVKATPAMENSQFYEFDTIAVADFWLSADVISPDNDGYEDVLFIYYKTFEAGYVGNVELYSRYGNKVKTLAINTSLASDGFWVWDGLANDGSRLPAGIYVVVIKLYNAQGKMFIHRLPLVVSYKQ